MPNLTFTAIDVETANRTKASICQIGIALVHAGKITRTASILINPEEPFEPINIHLHGINENTVENAATIPSIYPRIHRIMEGTTLVSHTRFDQQAFEKATAKYGLRMPHVRWLDSAQIARRAWPQKYAKGGPSLKSVMADLGIMFKHHDAEEDARAAAEILLHTHRHTGLDVDDWLEQAKDQKGSTAGATRRLRRQSPPNEDKERTKPTPAPAARWTNLLTKILRLEQDKDFNNSSVIGGVDDFLQQQARNIAGELGNSGAHRLLLRFQYRSLTVEERSWWIDQWLEIIARRQQQHPTTPGQKAVTKITTSAAARKPSALLSPR